MNLPQKFAYILQLFIILSSKSERTETDRHSIISQVKYIIPLNSSHYRQQNEYMWFYFIFFWKIFTFIFTILKNFIFTIYIIMTCQVYQTKSSRICFINSHLFPGLEYGTLYQMINSTNGVPLNLNRHLSSNILQLSRGQKQNREQRVEVINQVENPGEKCKC